MAFFVSRKEYNIYYVIFQVYYAIYYVIFGLFQ